MRLAPNFLSIIFNLFEIYLHMCIYGVSEYDHFLCVMHSSPDLETDT